MKFYNNIELGYNKRVTIQQPLHFFIALFFILVACALCVPIEVDPRCIMRSLGPWAQKNNLFYLFIQATEMNLFIQDYIIITFNLDNLVLESNENIMLDLRKEDSIVEVICIELELYFQYQTITNETFSNVNFFKQFTNLHFT